MAASGPHRSAAPGRLVNVGTIPLRTKVMDVLSQLGRAAIGDLDQWQLEAVRNRPVRYVPPITWFTGPVLPSVRISTSEIEVRDGASIGVRWYHPTRCRRQQGQGCQQEPKGHALHGRQTLPLVVYLHGGGWVVGSPANYDPLCTFLAEAAEVVVASIHYRLAPEHPAPAGLQDCIDAIEWLSREGKRAGADSDRMGIAGDSAGGNLAAAAVQHFAATARESGRANVLKHQALLYPSLDSTCLYKSKIDRANGPMLRRYQTDAYLALYLGTGPDALSTHDPRISPMLGSLAGLPPTLIQTAGLDPLRDEGLRYAGRLRAAGIEVVATDYSLCPHGFANYPGAGRGGWAHRAELAHEVRQHLHAGLPTSVPLD